MGKSTENAESSTTIDQSNANQHPTSNKGKRHRSGSDDILTRQGIKRPNNGKEPLNNLGNTAIDVTMAATAAAGAPSGAAPNSSSASSAPSPQSDDEMRQFPRRYGIEIAGSWTSSISSRRELGDKIDAIRPEDSQIREIIKTERGKILIFAVDMKNYNGLLKREKWRCNDISVLPTQRQTLLVQ